MVTRRELLAGLGLGGVGTAWLGINHAAPEYDSRHNGHYPFEEPILDLAFPAVELGYPTYYQQVLETRAELDRLFRREYVRSEFASVAEAFDGFDMSSGFVTVFGLVMPRTRTLTLTDRHVEVDWLAGPGVQRPRTLTLEYRVIENTSATDDERFHTVVTYFETEGSRPPDELAVEIRRGQVTEVGE